MAFIFGVLVGILLTIGLIFLLLFIAKALGFTMMLKNDWRKDHGYEAEDEEGDEEEEAHHEL